MRNSQQQHDVRRASIRVALTATAVVGAAYLLIAIAVVVIVTRNLTTQIDARLTDNLQHIASEPPMGDHDSGNAGPFVGGPYQPVGPKFGPQFLVWFVHPDGTLWSSDTSAALPKQYWNAEDPQTADISGTSMRIEGTDIRDDHVVVGQTTESVSQAESTVVLAELLIGPVLLILVFLGAVAIGRRVASPIELARQRQMDFTADASHELRTPLSVIEAQTSLALTQDRTEEWYRGAFRRVDGESKRMRRLLDDLLWLARFDASRGQPNAEPVDVAVLAAQTVDRFGAIAEARHLTLSVAAQPGSHVVTAPPEWLDRLLGVLLDNACKYSPDGGAVRVAVASDGGRVRLIVEDSGPGIPAEERQRVLDRFHRATGAPGSGAGLGLAIADAIVRATNGRWQIGGSPSGGASMSVSWPRAFVGARETPVGATTPSRLPSE